MKVAIVDYDMGNLFSVEGACRAVGLDAVVTSDAQDIERANGVILPGVGAFSEAMRNLHDRDLVDPLRRVITAGKPFLGICLGMQLLLSESAEFGVSKGLDVIAGEVKRFPPSASGKPLRVPHVGWSGLLESGQPWEGTILRKTPAGTPVYFVHSFFAVPFDPTVVLSATEYGGVRFCSAIHMGNVFATQFHPEKSGQAGLEMYRSWKDLINEEG